MSIRTLIEINHDLVGRHEGLVEALARYAASASREHAEALEPYGLKVIGMRHHSTNYVLDGEPEGFPVQILKQRKPA